MTSSSSAEKIEYWFVFQRGHLLVLKDQGKLLTSPSITSIKNFFLRQQLLSQSESFAVYCAEIPEDMALSAEIDSLPLRKALELVGPNWYNIAAKAYAIINWDTNHQFCGRCGYITVQEPGTFERICTACLLTFYPRISPSIIVLIQKDDHLLMARGHHFIPGVYGLIAGFVEAGESVEDAVHREVDEEVGLKIKNLRYFGSQSWPFPDSLMLAFTADHASGELTINHAEIEEAGWYHFEHLPGNPSSSISIARKLINHFVAEKKKAAQS